MAAGLPGLLYGDRLFATMAVLGRRGTLFDLKIRLRGLLTGCPVDLLDERGGGSDNRAGLAACARPTHRDELPH
jgi:hypothetical protein